jgi:hypothetical protein
MVTLCKPVSNPQAVNVFPAELIQCIHSHLPRLWAAIFTRKRSKRHAVVTRSPLNVSCHK